VTFGINGEKDPYQRGKETISTRHGYPLWISMDIYGYLWISTANYPRFAMFKAI
jgi:hypothetical protein